MKSTPTNSSVDAYCFVQWAPSLVAKMACDPTAQPARGPTIWMAPSAGTNPGSMPVAVGVGVADALADGVGDGEASGDAEPLGVAVGVGVGLAADVEVHPPRAIVIAMAVTACPIRRD
jgi:hypothetical protein